MKYKCDMVSTKSEIKTMENLSIENNREEILLRALTMKLIMFIDE